MIIRLTPPILYLLACACLVASPLQPVVDDSDRIAVARSVHPALARLEPVGVVAPDLALDRMILVLKMDDQAQARLDAFLKDQQDPASPSYHQWLTPEGFGQKFGPSQAQVDAATLWLLQQGFTVQGTARSGLAITFSGSAADVSRAFRTAVMEYDVDGVHHRANATSVSLPRGLAGFVGGVVSLHDFRRKSGHRLLRPMAGSGTANHFMGAADFATIYNLKPLFAAGTTGTGVTIGVVARCDIGAFDHYAFASNFGLVAYNGQFETVHTGADPGVLDLNEEFEADIDSQWTTATAPGADVKLVISPSSVVTDGVDLSAQYIVDSNLASVMTTSFGSCEAQMGTAENAFYNQLWAQAAGQGISVFVSSGDNGVAGCDNPDEFQGTGLGVSGLASTPYNTAVGGTMFNEGSGTYWTTSPSFTFAATATGYIPEAAWNESGTASGGDRLWAGSGGVSSLYAKPSWQSALNVPADGRRDIPDVAFSSATGTDPYLVYVGLDTAPSTSTSGLYLAGGTSVATPSMAGIMALVVQRNGRQGNANPTLYRLGRAQYAGTGPAVFHDVTTGNNAVPGVQGFTAAAGYDLATGLGSLDATALVNNWVAGANPITTAISTPAAPVTIASGQSVAFSGSASGGTGLTYTWAFGDGATATGATASHTYTSLGSLTRTFQATLTASDGAWSQSRSVNVTVTPAGVSAYILQPYLPVLGFPGQTMAFAATALTQNQANITGYAWDFGDGATATGATASHAFTSNTGGYYTVTVTATDGTGAKGQASTQIYAYVPWAMDLDFNNAIDVRDLLVLCGAWGTAAASASNLTGFYPFGCDFNGDGKVDDTDLNLWLANFVPGAK